jgi:hypothetical protein
MLPVFSTSHRKPRSMRPLPAIPSVRRAPQLARQAGRPMAIAVAKKGVWADLSLGHLRRIQPDEEQATALRCLGKAKPHRIALIEGARCNPVASSEHRLRSE